MAYKSTFTFLLLLYFFNNLVAQQSTFSGLFTNRDGLLEVISTVTPQGYQLDIIQEGERLQAEAKDIGGGNIEGTFVREKEKINFKINYENGYYFFVTTDSAIPLTQQTEIAESNKPIVVEKKKYTDHRYATGARIYDGEHNFAFNLPDEDWNYSNNNGIFSLQKPALEGWIKVIPHDLGSLEDAKDEKSIYDFLNPGNYEATMNPTTYGRLSLIRQFQGTDAQGRQLRFFIMTIVSLDGGGLHVISGAHASKFEPAYERYGKVILDSVEFIH